MRLMAILFVLCVTVNASEGVPTNGMGNASHKPDGLFQRTGIYLQDIPAEAPEDKLYPVADNLCKLDEYHRMHGKRIEAKDLPRFERAYRQWGVSDGVFNNPEWIRKGDEWDAKMYTVAKRNDSGELVPLSRRDVTSGRVQHRPYFSRGNSPLWLTPLGQLCKQCDGVFVGVISGVGGLSDEEKTGLELGRARVDRPAHILFQVETNLFGRISGNTVTIPLLWMEGKGHAPTNGMRLLVFYARGFTIRETDVNRKYYLFDWEKPPEVPDAPPAITRELMSSIRILDSPETEKAYTEAASGYMRLLRREKRDPDRYYEFLRPLVKSPVWRIRQDAKEDILWLIGPVAPDRFDFKRIVNDPELDWDLVKDYVRYIAIPEREKRHADAQKKQ